ncbi:MAG: hypothetical protein JOS17DRAFT_737561 [Linnemannia elongata]|nr:MAG: hypothetical protein JOS17DRAFT_737561 [Linnemannia elongata]
MIFNVVSTASALAILSLSASAAPGKPGQIVQITSSTNWCMMMPPQAGGDIAANEDRAIAFCTSPSSSAPAARIFPDGFIQFANFAKGDGYVQITGKIDASKYSLSDSDRGGQYDIKAPVGSACAGYNHYVNLIEPHSNTMCIRCCKEKKNCNTGKSTYGCAAVIPGDYSDPDSSSSSVSARPTGTATNSGVSPSGSATGTATATGTAPVSTETGSLTIDPIFPTTGTATISVPTLNPSITTVTPTVTAPTVSPSTTPNAASSKSQSVGVLAVAVLGVIAVLVL